MSSPTIEQGRAALRDGDAATAQRAFELALAEDGPGEALESLGEALYLQCDYPAAAAYYARAYAAFRRERSHGRRPGGAPNARPAGRPASGGNRPRWWSFSRSGEPTNSPWCV